MLSPFAPGRIRAEHRHPSRNTGWMIDTRIREFYTPTGASPEDVIVVVGIDSALFVEHELWERVQEIAEKECRR